MKVLVACEFSGVVRDAFTLRGHDAWSCDILPTESPGNHIQGNVLDILNEGWDLMIAHPPCTYLSIANNMLKQKPYWSSRLPLREKAIEFFISLVNAPIDKICVENPPGYMSTFYRKPDQYIQPYWFGCTDSKKTGLWLKNLPPLKATNVLKPNMFTCKNGKKKIQYGV